MALSDCQVKEGGFHKGLEIVAASRSKVVSSTKKFKLPCDLSCIDPDASNEVRIKELEDLVVMQSVTVNVKVILVGMLEHVQVKDSWRGLTKQECVVGNATETIRIVLWEKKIGCLQQDRCYKVADVHVKEFQGKKYLSVPEKGTIQYIDDVAEMDSDDERLTAAAVVKGVVKAVLSCEEHLSCVNCSSKIIRTG